MCLGSQYVLDCSIKRCNKDLWDGTVKRERIAFVIFGEFHNASDESLYESIVNSCMRLKHQIVHLQLTVFPVSFGV